MAQTFKTAFLSFLVSFLGLLVLSACGFTPMYGGVSANGDNAVQSQLNSVKIANIPDYQGQFLRNRLVDKFYHDGPPADPAYTLNFSPITIIKTDLDLTKNASATRSQLSVRVSMTLTDNKTGQIVMERGLTSAASYDILQSRFTTRVSEENAQQNALEDIARQTEQQLVLYFHR